MEEAKEEKLRKVIRSNIRETIFGKDFTSKETRDLPNQSSKIGSYNSSSTRIEFYEESDDSVYMKILNKTTGEFSDKIYIDNVEEFSKVLNGVNILT